MLKFIGVMWSQTNWMLWKTGWPQLVPRHNDQQNLRHSKKLMLHHLFPGKKKQVQVDFSKQMFCTCVCFPVISGLFSQTPPGPPSHPLPVASSLQVGGGEPRGRSERHIGHHVSLGCGSIGFFWGRCYAFIGGKRLGDWWYVDLDICFVWDSYELCVSTHCWWFNRHILA